MTYKATSENTNFLERTASHSTKGSRRGFVRDDFVALHQQQIRDEREVVLALRRCSKNKTASLYAIGGQHEKASQLGRLNRKLKKVCKALDAYTFLISGYVDQDNGDHRTIEDFEKARIYARTIRQDLEALKAKIEAIDADRI